MTRYLFALAMAFSVFFALTARAQETGPVVEVFACDYKDGRGQSDLAAAVQFWNAQMNILNAADAAGSGQYFAAVLTPYRATTGHDFFWVGASPNLNTMLADSYAYLSSQQGQAAEARFDEIAECESNTYFSEQLLDALPVPEQGDVLGLAEVYACTFEEGKDLADAEQAEQNWVAVANAHGAQVDVYRWLPFYANTPTDVIYLIVSDGFVAFGDYRTRWLTSEDGRAADEKFNAVMNCESALMIGRTVRAPEPPG